MSLDRVDHRSRGKPFQTTGGTMNAETAVSTAELLSYITTIIQLLHRTRIQYARSTENKFVTFASSLSAYLKV